MRDNDLMPRMHKETARFLQAWMRVRQIVQAANFNRFHREGLSATQFMTLNLVPPEGITLSELARRLNLSAATLSETVKSLESRALVRRSRSVADSRKVDIQATEAGKQMQNASSQEFHSSIAALFRAMTPAERSGLLAGLEKMAELSEGGATETTTLRGDAALPVLRSSRRSRQPKS